MKFRGILGGLVPLLFFSVNVLAAPAPGIHHSGVLKPLAEIQAVFDYSSQDGDFQLPCVIDHFDSELNDFKVTCGKGTVHEMHFYTHLIVRRWLHQGPPAESAYEVIYSVISESTPAAQGYTSQYLWLSVQGDSPLKEARVSQSVENDYAFLNVTLSAK